jgi:hypothetical protein
MLGLLLLLALSSPGLAQDEAPSEPALEQPALQAEPTQPPAEELDEAPELATARPEKRARPNQLTAQERDDRPLWLAISALLALLVVSRMQPYRKEAIRTRRTRTNRPTPITDEELGRFVFHAVIAADLDEYRALFLTGAEAGQLLGRSHAEDYLASRSPEKLEDALVELAVQIPVSSHFAGVERAGDLLSVIIANEQGTEKMVLIGTVADIGTAHRIVSPASQLQQRAAE